MILFWDLQNDTPEILGDDGRLWSYGEDSVAIAQGLDSGYHWTLMCKTCDVTPFNTPDRFEVFDEIRMLWCRMSETEMKFYAKIKKTARCHRGTECQF